MPQRELKHPSQIEAWLTEWGDQLGEPGALILIGSGGLLWHAAQRGLDLALPENSMDVDPVTQSVAVALLGYESMIGSEFEKQHGWHVNFMPTAVPPSNPLMSTSGLPAAMLTRIPSREMSHPAGGLHRPEWPRLPLLRLSRSPCRLCGRSADLRVEGAGHC